MGESQITTKTDTQKMMKLQTMIMIFLSVLLFQRTFAESRLLMEEEAKKAVEKAVEKVEKAVKKNEDAKEPEEKPAAKAKRNWKKKCKTDVACGAALKDCWKLKECNAWLKTKKNADWSIAKATKMLNE